jgi:hypothetical protein
MEGVEVRTARSPNRLDLESRSSVKMSSLEMPRVIRIRPPEPLGTYVLAVYTCRQCWQQSSIFDSRTGHF